MKQRNKNGNWSLFAGMILAAWIVHESAAWRPVRSVSQFDGKNTLATDSHGDPLPKYAMQRFGGLRFRVTGNYGPPVFAPDGKHFATWEGDIHIWDRSTGKVLKRLPGYNSRADYLQYSPDGSRIVASARDNKVFVWNVASGKKEFEAGGIVPVFSKDGKQLYTGGKRTNHSLQNIEVQYVLCDEPIRRWDLVKRMELPSFGKGVPVAISPNGKRLASITAKFDWSAMKKRSRFSQSPKDPVRCGPLGSTELFLLQFAQLYYFLHCLLAIGYSTVLVGVIYSRRLSMMAGCCQ